MKTRLEQLEDVLRGTADEETRNSLQHRLRDPDSDACQFFNTLREADREDPFEMAWTWLLPSVAAGRGSAAASEPVAPAKGSRSTRTMNRYQLAGTIAATLVLGLAVGFLASRGGWGDVPPTLIASADVSFKGSRDPGDPPPIPVIEAKSNIPGFLTVIVLHGETLTPWTLPIAPDDDVRLPGDGGAIKFELPADVRDGTAALVLVTATPAADTLDKALYEREFSDQDIGPLRELVENTLKEKGHRTVFIQQVSLEPPESR